MITPIEKHGDYWLKRDDLFELAGIRGGKVRTCHYLATQRPTKGLVTASSRSSPQAEIVARIASMLGVRARLHMPHGAETDAMRRCREQGAEIIQHKPGYNTQIIYRANQDRRGLPGWTTIPFGMECREAVEQTAKQITENPGPYRLPRGRIVVPVGSGMSLCGVLTGLHRIKSAARVLGVRVGGDPSRRFREYGPGSWNSVSIVMAPEDYHKAVDAKIGDVVLDPHYEAKCVQFLEPGDLLWVVGIRPGL